MDFHDSICHPESPLSDYFDPDPLKITPFSLHLHGESWIGDAIDGSYQGSDYDSESTPNTPLPLYSQFESYRDRTASESYVNARSGIPTSLSPAAFYTESTSTSLLYDPPIPSLSTSAPSTYPINYSNLEEIQAIRNQISEFLSDVNRGLQLLVRSLHTFLLYFSYPLSLSFSPSLILSANSQSWKFPKSSSCGKYSFPVRTSVSSQSGKST